MFKITEDQKKELLNNGYYLAKTDYYNPGGELYYNAVFYPDGKCQKYKKVGLGWLSLNEQWSEAWKHYEFNRGLDNANS